MKTATIPFVKHQAQDLRLPPVYVTYVTIQKTWTLVDAREVRLETVDSLRGNVVGWIDPTPDTKIG